MTKLSTLRSQLTALRRARAGVRAATAWSAAGIALLWALAAVFVVDFLFELPPSQRVVLLLIAALAVVWAAKHYVWPLLGVAETDEEMALMVERQQQIDSDLVAALQFESSAAATWGSVQLEHAVIDYVAQVGPGLNVFEGFDRRQMTRRAAVLALTAGVLLVAAVIFPGHARAFFNRMILGGMHYPTATTIEQIVLNHVAVLVREEHGSAPRRLKAAEGRPIVFLIHGAGNLPAEGKIRLVSLGPARTTEELKLVPLTLHERLSRLQQAQRTITGAIGSGEVDISPPWRNQVVAQMAFDAPAAATAMQQVNRRGDLAGVSDALAAALKNWPGERAQTGIYRAELGRLIDNVSYQVFLGDAWTDPATITMTPLPVVEPRFTPVPPAYARATQTAGAIHQRQLSVLEGSSVRVAIECTNQKPLLAAWLMLQSPAGARRYDLVKQDADGLHWSLAVGTATPFDKVTEELRYAIQVEDIDHLSLESPIRGAIRLRADRPPSGSAELIHRVVLPTAEPVIHYRATDDFGISKVNLLVDIERPMPESPTAIVVPAADVTASESSQGVTSPSTESTAAERRTFPLVQGAPLRGTALPLQSTYALQLASLRLAKGDRLKLTLEVVDYRGEDEQGNPTGQNFLSEPLVLEIADESGVLAAISEADERSEERLTEIIKRQLGIGESP